jgi:hypothetical protein
VRERTPNYNCITLYVYQLMKAYCGMGVLLYMPAVDLVYINQPFLSMKKLENKFNFVPGFPYIWAGFDSHESTDILPFLQN